MAPDKGQTDIARHFAGKIEHAGSEVKPLLFQVALPTQIEFGSLAAER